MWRSRFLVLFLSALPACISTEKNSLKTGSSEAGVGWFAEIPVRSPASAPNADLPWEVHGVNGETLVPNVYYAERSENQQVMPVAINGHVMIDRLVYPTLGNPSLYVRSAAVHQPLFVLRLEELALQHLEPSLSADSERPDYFERLSLGKDEPGTNELGFYLINRARRAAGEAVNPLKAGSGVYRIKPIRIQVDRISAQMPEEFKKRRTLRVSFSHDSLVGVPAGLYDIRFQVLKGGQLAMAGNEPVYEFQYNALRIFETFDFTRYTVLNVTDSQVSGGLAYSKQTADKLEEFVEYVNRASGQHGGTPDPNVKRAAFITFNGDLHNGGAPAGMFSRFVARTYNAEAAAIVDILKELDLPIFLCVGNHDGYAGTTAVPAGVSKYEGGLGIATDIIDNIGDFIGKKLSHAKILADLAGHAHLPIERVVEKYALDTKLTAWPEITLDAFSKDRQVAASNPGGRANNIVVGRHIRVIPAGTPGSSKWLDEAWRNGWRQVAGDRRNMILFDGFHQWQKTYGPLYFSWVFGNNHFVNINSFELRQHRRTGWGMYTVNYGGWVMPTQIDWIQREMSRAQSANRDIIMLAHHDPRGGHRGKDYPYYFKQVDFTGMQLSASNYVKGQVIQKNFCATAPTWAQNISNDQALGCMHDGLQEWMRPDAKYDCSPDLLLTGSADLECDPEKMKSSTPWYSGYEMITLMAGEPGQAYTRYPNFRTLLLGHTHYNSLEVAQDGDELVPAKLQLDSEAAREIAEANAANPVRALSLAGQGDSSVASDKPIDLKMDQLNKNDFGYVLDIEKQYRLQRVVQRPMSGEPRELAILRMTAVSTLTKQSFEKDAMYGFAAIDIEPATDARNYALPQVDRVTYYINRGGKFEFAGPSVTIDRAHHLGAKDPNNPVSTRFSLK